MKYNMEALNYEQCAIVRIIRTVIIFTFFFKIFFQKKNNISYNKSKFLYIAGELSKKIPSLTEKRGINKIIQFPFYKFFHEKSSQEYRVLYDFPKTNNSFSRTNTKSDSNRAPHTKYREKNLEVFFGDQTFVSTPSPFIGSISTHPVNPACR